MYDYLVGTVVENACSLHSHCSHTYTLPPHTYTLPSHTLSDVVRLERPDLERQRNELIVNINKAKNELKVGKLILSMPAHNMNYGAMQLKAFAYTYSLHCKLYECLLYV